MDLSIVIVSYNAVDFLRLCLKSVAAACRSIKTEVFVVDNHSSDHSVEMVKNEFAFCKVIANQHNPGFAIANNQAIHQSTGKYVLLLNPDTVVAEDTFTKVISFMNNNSNAGGLGIRMLDGSGCFLPESKRGIPSPWTSFSKMTGLSALFPTSKLFSEYHKGYLNQGKTNSIEVLAGAFMCFSKKVLDEVGLLDEDFFMYGEDIDLSYRILKGGYKNYYFANSSIIHFKGESTIKDRKYVSRFYKAMIQFAKKHYNKGYGLLLSLLIYLGVFMAKSISFIRYLLANKSQKSVDKEEVFILFSDYLPSQEVQKALSQKYAIKVIDKLSEELEGTILFVLDKMPYKQIISCMDKNKDRFKYRFFDEQHRMIIGSDDKCVKGAILRI